MNEVKRKPKKEVIQVAGNPKYQPIVKVSPKKEIPNPRTGELDWAHVPELKTASKTFPAGPIRLRYGEHWGPERGYGLTHIWEARKFKSAVLASPMDAIHVVDNLIMSILQSGAEIYHDATQARSVDRPVVFWTNSGTVVVEERVDGTGKAFYSIVTAIPKKNPKGTLIGNLV